MFNQTDTGSFSLAHPKRTSVMVVLFALCTAALTYKFDVVPVLLVVLGIGLLALVFANTEFATLVVIFVLYTNFAVVLSKYHGVPGPIAASFFLLLGIPLTSYLLMRRQPIVINGVFWLMLAQLGIMLASTFFAADPRDALSYIFVYLTEGIVLYFLILNTVRTQAMLRKAIWTLILAGCVMGTFSLVQGITGSKQSFGGFAQVKDSRIGTGQTAWGGKHVLRDTRAAGTVGEENYYAQIMLMLVPLAFSRFWFEHSRRLRMLGLLACVPIGGAIIFTFSRGAFVSAVAMVFAMLLLGQVKLRHVAVAGLAFAVVVPLVMPEYAYRISTLFRAVGLQTSEDNAKTLDTSMRGRATENMAAVKIFLHNPVLGVGPGQTHMYTTKYGSSGLSRLSGTRQAHNMYLGVLSDTGAIGLLGFLSIFGASIFGLMKIRRYYAQNPELAGMAIGLLLAIVTFMASAVFLSSAYERFYWLVLALAGVAIQVFNVTTESKVQQLR